MKATPKHKKYIGPEKNFQITTANYLDSLGVLWFHCPNGGTRNKREAISLKKEGVKSGVPDVIILEPRGKWCGLFIELKTGYNKPSENQLTFLERLKRRNYKTLVSWSLDEVINEIDKYLKTK